MTQQPQTPQPEGQQSASQPSGSGFNASGIQQDLTTKTVSVNNAWILTGLGGLLFISLFIPWMTVSAGGFGGAGSANGLDKSGLLIVTSLVVAAAGVGVALRKIPLWGVAAAAVAALIQLLITFSAMGDVSDAKQAVGGLVKVSQGFGLWLSLIGAVGVIGLAVYAYLKDKVDYVSTGPLFPQQNNNQPPAPQGPAA